MLWDNNLELSQGDILIGLQQSHGQGLPLHAVYSETIKDCNSIALQVTTVFSFVYMVEVVEKQLTIRRHVARAK